MPHFPRRDPAEWAFVLDEPARDLLLRMLEYDPTRRISCSDALKHPWFADVAGIEEEAKQLAAKKLSSDRELYAHWAEEERKQRHAQEQQQEAMRHAQYHAARQAGHGGHQQQHAGMAGMFASYVNTAS